MIFFWLMTGYLFGSLPCGYILFRLAKGDDIRKYGSGNIGATNIGRMMGTPWAVLVAMGDMFKGGIAVILAYLSGFSDPWIISMTGLAAVLGHNFPIWLNFQGGKGVSTTFGVVIFFIPPVSFIVASVGGLIWLFTLKILRYVSIASLLSLFSLPFAFYVAGSDRAFIIISLLLACISCFQHRTNISRILKGTEMKAGNKEDRH